jgi:hypothetical protein
MFDVNTREDLKTKARFNFTASTSWQGKGEYLAVMLSKMKKDKKKGEEEEGEKAEEKKKLLPGEEG